MSTLFFRAALRRPALALLLATPLLLTACKDKNEDPKPTNDDNELITTVRYRLTSTTVLLPPVEVQFRDLDGDGGNPPVITSADGTGRLRLRKGLTYAGDLLVLDESKSPADTTSNEIRREAAEHLFVYTAAPAGLLTTTITDRDANNLPLGLATTVQAPAAGSGSLTITLRHQPGTKNGTAAPGDTDIEVTFPVEIID